MKGLDSRVVFIILLACKCMGTSEQSSEAFSIKCSSYFHSIYLGQRYHYQDLQ
jgi:hypothetical protein